MMSVPLRSAFRAGPAPGPSRAGRIDRALRACGDCRTARTVAALLRSVRHPGWLDCPGFSGFCSARSFFPPGVSCVSRGDVGRVAFRVLGRSAGSPVRSVRGERGGIVWEEPPEGEPVPRSCYLQGPYGLKEFAA